VIRLAVVATAFTTGMFVSTPFANSVAARSVPASLPVAATTPPSTTPAPLPVAPPAPPVAKRPLRVLVIGDSMMWLTAPAVQKVLQPQIAGRRVTVVKLGPGGAGLVSKGNFDWKRRVQQFIETEDPDIVVALFIGSCPAPLDLDINGHPLVCETPAIYNAWARASNELTGIMTSRGAQAVWVLPPPQLTEALRSVPGPDGTAVPLRTRDTVHVTDEGSRRLGGAILAEVRPDIDRGPARS
jgi:hypothetical protein